ncbi:MAG: hypothetical protein KA419_14795 [Acidobacteria bacterium]|nr:hypothetical protein [Acidobacteriota bacterium]
MSLRRRVKLNIELTLAGEETLDLRLPGLLPRERLGEILRKHLLGDGWVPEGDKVARRSTGGSEVCDPAAGTVTVALEREAPRTGETEPEEDLDAARRRIAGRIRREFTDELEGRIEKVRGEFLRKYVPATVADAVVEKARALDPAARVTRSETDGELVVSIELEAAP